MKKNPKIMELNRDWQLYRGKQGIQLLPPSKTSPLSPRALSSVMNYPLNFFFLDTEGNTLLLNDQCAEVCGFQSINDAYGKSLMAVSKPKSALQLIHNAGEVLVEKKIKIYDELNERKDGQRFPFLSIKMPWMNHENKIMGSFGCSIVLNKNPLAESLSYISTLGLLHPPHLALALQPTTPGKSFIALSDKETECTHYLCKGLTIKQIAKQLSLSPKTIETYLERAKNKLHCRNKAELIANFLQLSS